MKWMLMAVILAAGWCARAEEPAVDAAASKTVKNSLNAGLTLTDGNSDTMAANISLSVQGENKDLGSMLAGAEWNYGEDTEDGEKDKTVDNAKVYGNVKKTLSQLTFASLDATYLNDDIAWVDYWFKVGPGFGAYLLKKEENWLTLEGGPAYLWEKVDEIRDDYLALWVTERLAVRLSDKARLVQSLEYIVEASEFDNCQILGEIGVEAPIAGRLSLRVVLQDKYDSTPATGSERNDLSLIAGLGLSL